MVPPPSLCRPKGRGVDRNEVARVLGASAEATLLLNDAGSRFAAPKLHSQWSGDRLRSITAQKVKQTIRTSVQGPQRYLNCFASAGRCLALRAAEFHTY